METTGSKPTNELIRLAIIGDGAAFTALWDTNIDALKAYLRATMKNLDDFYIDDICSRSFEKAFRQIRSYDPSKSRFSTWLRTIAHNTAVDLIESELKANREVVSLDEPQSSALLADGVQDSASTPLEEIIQEEDNAKRRNYIDALPELYRDVAHKRIIEGMQYKEIAEETGLELNTVRTRIRRAKQMIDRMKKDDSDEKDPR